MIVAPVAREKKGEFVELFADMQAQGYVRFRINGQIVEAADLQPLVKMRSTTSTWWWTG